MPVRNGGSRWVRPATTVYRKVLLAAEGARAIVEVAVASTVMALAGFLLYFLVYPSGVILFEALVWSIEAMAFTAVALALKVAGSRTLFYRARYEVFRVEALAISVLSALGLAVTVWIIWKAVAGQKGSTPLPLAVYPLGSALASYVLEHRLLRRVEALSLRLVSIRAVASKLKYDVAVEAAGGVAIIVSNLYHQPLAETGIIVVVGLYVFYGLSMLLYEHLLYLVGPGPRERRAELRAWIKRIAARHGYKVARQRVEVYGTFAEAEVWVEMPPATRLYSAHRASLELARALVHEIPDLLRVVVVPVPERRPAKRRTRHRRYQKKPQPQAQQREGQSAQGTT